jgi:cyclopropane fatty-acyl-phospholipid synthase-like methyltransferase
LTPAISWNTNRSSILRATGAKVARLIDVFQLPVGARILDCPCGHGRHAHLFAESGFDVDGVDYSRDVLAAAEARGVGDTLRYKRD